MKQEKITYDIIKTSRDLDTIVVNSGGRKIPLHSKVDPERDSGLLSDRLDPSRYDFLIILGVGLGYHCLPLKNYIERYARIILVDILDGIDTAIGRNRLTSFLISDPRVTLVTGKSIAEVESVLSEYIDMDAIRGISVLEHPASVRIFSDYYGSVKKSIDKIISIKAGNKATRKAFGARYLRNILLNFSIIERAHPVRGLYNAFAGFPVIIAGSGPSLDGDAEMMARHQDLFFIISVDSALPVLQGRGINPDIVISIDPQPYVFEHFQDCDCGNVLTVHSISSHPSLVKRPGAYLSLNSHPLSQLASEVYGGTTGSVDSGTGSVAGDAVSLAMKCGFSAIGITGLDFSFSGFSIYARGTAYQRRYGVFLQDRFSTVEGLNMRYIMTSSGGFKQGGRFTRKSFLHYHRSLEDFIRDNAASPVIALNDRGITLEGAARTGIVDFIRQYCPADIQKKKIVSGIQGTAPLIDRTPLASAIGRIVDDAIFDELLAASLDGPVDEGMKDRYRSMALLAGQGLQ